MIKPFKFLSPPSPFTWIRTPTNILIDDNLHHVKTILCSSFASFIFQNRRKRIYLYSIRVHPFNGIEYTEDTIINCENIIGKCMIRCIVIDY